VLVTPTEFEASRYYKADWKDEVPFALSYAESRFYQLTQRERWGYWMERKTLTMHLDGTNTRILRCPYPLLKIESCVIKSPGGDVDVVEDVRFRGHFLWLAEKWLEGFANITLTGEFGDPKYALASVTVEPGSEEEIPSSEDEEIPSSEDEEEDEEEEILGNVPADVKEAVMRLANMKMRHYRIAGERLQERRPPDEPVPPPTITGDREVDGIIRSYTVQDISYLLDIRGPMTDDEMKFEV